MGFIDNQNLGFSAFGQSTPKRVLVGLVSTKLLDANPSAIYRQINNNTPGVMWIQEGIPAVVGEGTRVLPGRVVTLEGDTLYLGQINAIAVITPLNMDVLEGV